MAGSAAPPREFPVVRRACAYRSEISVDVPLPVFPRHGRLFSQLPLVVAVADAGHCVRSPAGVTASEWVRQALRKMRREKTDAVAVSLRE